MIRSVRLLLSDRLADRERRQGNVALGFGIKHVDDASSNGGKDFALRCRMALRGSERRVQRGTSYESPRRLRVRGS
jgi:hypothetical protein